MISGKDMTRNFWHTTVQGGYCTHGETFLPGTQEGEKATRTGEKDVVWWAKGGRLNGESPARIAFLREIIESLPGPLEPMNGQSGWFGKDDDEIWEICAQAPEGFRIFLQRIVWMDQRERDNFYSVEFQYSGRCGDMAFLYYKDDQCCAMTDLELPKDHSYQVDVIDTWEMARKTVLHGASGNVRIQMPGKKYMAVLALREDID